MSRIFALGLAGIGGVCLTLAVQAAGELSFTQLSPPTYYLTLAFIAFVKAAVFAADAADDY